MGLIGSSYSDASSNTTINATPMTLLARTMDANSSGLLKVFGIARRIDGATKSFSLQSVGYVNEGGMALFNNVVDLLGSAGDLIALLAATLTVDTSGSDVRIRATGIAATEIDWTVLVNGVLVQHQ